MPDHAADDYLNLSEVAKLLGVSGDTLRARLKRHRIVPLRSRSDLREKLLRRRDVPALAANRVPDLSPDRPQE